MREMDPKKISISDYTYSLPQERIAHHPLAQRDQSKLLVFNKGQIQVSSYRHIADFLPENSLVVFNNTKVVEAGCYLRNNRALL
jgi:S-adenosylmethionine:tRNA ribosyltransferase-isomerase